MLQRLPIAFSQVRASNTFENLLNEIREVIYSLHRAKEIIKRVYNNMMNPIKFQCQMDTIFANSENRKISDLHRSLLNLTDKINLKRSDKYVVLSSFQHIPYATIRRKTQKSHTKTIDLKYQLQRGMKNLNYLMDHIFYQISKVVLSILSKNIKKVIDNLPIYLEQKQDIISNFQHLKR